MTIIDTHTHLYDLPDLAGSLREAADAGVTDVVALGVDLASNQKHIEMCQSAPGRVRIHPALGLHPGNITTREDTAACLQVFQENF